MKSIGAFDAKTHLPRLLERVSRGERILITKHGKPVARVIPFPRRPADLLGSLADKIKVRGDILSTRIAWDLDAQP